MQKRAASHPLLPSFAVLVLAAGACVAQGQKKLVDKYTVIPIVLDDPLTSRTAHIGQKFATHNTEPAGAFPRNTTFVGVITEARPAGGGKAGLLAGKFTQAMLPNGHKVAIEGVPSTKDGVKIPNKTGSTAKKKSGEKGAVVGAAAGGIFGQTLGGALIGGAAGFGVGKAVQGKTTDAEIKAGARGYLMLTQSAWVPAGP
jgi:hypothetical protein